MSLDLYSVHSGGSVIQVDEGSIPVSALFAWSLHVLFLIPQEFPPQSKHWCPVSGFW